MNKELEKNLMEVVKDFNETELISFIVYNSIEEYFFLDVHHNQVSASETVYADGLYILFGKNQFEERNQIGEKEIEMIKERLNEIKAS